MCTPPPCRSRICAALLLRVGNYQNFLYLLASVFVPLFAVFAVRYFVFGDQRRWNTGPSAPARWWLLVPWLLGFAAYQLVNPGQIGWWSPMWLHVRELLHLAPPAWVSASIVSFMVAALITLAPVLWRRHTAEAPLARATATGVPAE
jgi:NCS1 family nucleobase:cation symporter-1